MSIWDCINPKYWSVFGTPLIPKTDDLVGSGSNELRSKLTGFAIEVGLTGNEMFDVSTDS